MLQVISGKFYEPGGDITETAAEGVIYSNTAYPLPIVTPVATLTLVDASDGIGKYTVSYVARFEQRPNRVRILRMGESTIIEQFRLLTLFSFKAYFSTARNEVMTTCYVVEGAEARNRPASYVRTFFDPVVELTPDDVQRFQRFVDKVIAMPRKSYEKVMDCLGCFADALELVVYNMDLAYSMLVYCAEALSQGFDNFVAGWEDVPEDTRSPLDEIFAGIDPASAEGIKKVLLGQQHFKLGQRFINFLSNHLPESFYTNDANGLVNPIRPSELKKLLTNVYGARSKFVHELNAIRNQIKVSQIGSGEVYHSFGDPYLTFNGMVRLLHTVLNEFIERQPIYTNEDFEWDRALSKILPTDVVELPPAPQHWIWEVGSAVPKLSARRLTGFLSSLLTREMTDMNAVVERYTTLLPDVPSEKDRLHMALLCELYFYVYGHMPGVRELKEKYFRLGTRLNKPSIHAMLYRLLTGEKWNWSPDRSAEMYTTYEKQRVGGEFSIPLVWELALILEVANQFGGASNESKCVAWKEKARLEATGDLTTQTDIANSVSAGGRFHLNGLFQFDAAVEDCRLVEERAFFISLRRKSSAGAGDDLSDWLMAEAEVFEMETQETMRQRSTNTVTL